LLQGHLNENTPFWWEGPDGGKVLMWYSRHYMQMQFMFGLPPLTQTGEEVLPLFLQMYQHPSYRANAAILFGTQVENTDLFPQQGELADAWNEKYAFPHIEVSGFHDALEAIAREFGDAIPTVRGDGGPYWEDGIGSDALYAAIERENESRAPSAEKLATISTLVNPHLAVNRDELSTMWENMVLMDEHTWLSWNSVSDPESDEAREQLRIKDSRATEAASQREDVLRSSMAALADSTAAGVDSLLVFNTLNWKRNGQVVIDLDNGTERQFGICSCTRGQITGSWSFVRKTYRPLDTRYMRFEAARRKPRRLSVAIRRRWRARFTELSSIPRAAASAALSTSSSVKRLLIRRMRGDLDSICM
jgi:hypothetical protein